MNEEEARKRLEEFERAKEAKNLIIENIGDLWIEYDKQTDTLYIYFGKEEANENIMLENDIIILKSGNKLLGIVINNFSSRYL
jgi:uncharacterized protein YuzE